MAVDLEELYQLSESARFYHLLGLLGRSRETAREVLIQALGPRHHRWVADTAALHLGRLADPQAVDIAIAYLEGPEPSRTSSAVRLLGHARADRAVPVLAALIPGGARSGVSGLAEAYSALARINTPRAQAALVAALQVADPRFVSEQAVGALCVTGTPEAVDVVLRLTTTIPHMWGADTLARVARVADERFTPFLIEVCAGPHRRTGLAGLGRAATTRAVEPLCHMFFTMPDRRERRVAGIALAQACDAVALITLRYAPGRHGRDSDELVWRDIAWLLGWVRRTDPQWRLDVMLQAAQLCAELLGHDDPLVRAQAARSLTRLGRSEHSETRHEPTRPIPELLSGLLADPAYRVRAAAAGALASIGAKAALPRLREVAVEDAVACVRDAAGAAVRRLA